MPCYQLIVLARPDVTAERLAELFRGVARVVFRERGQMRHIENFGVRPLAYPVRKYGRKFEEARWVHATFDATPGALANVGAAVSVERGVLQFKYLRFDNPLAQFKPGGKKEKLQRFSTAMRFNADVFDPETLQIKDASLANLQ